MAAEDATAKAARKDTERERTAKLVKALEAEKGATGAKLAPALERVLALEKQQRLLEDAFNTSKCCVAVVELCHAAADWDQLAAHLVLLAKRRAQLKQAIGDMVRACMKFLDELSDADCEKVITALQTVTEGKIYVEEERAGIIKRLATIKEKQGKVAEAADILQQVAVETLGTMEAADKIAYILDQVRLFLENKDFTRAAIFAKKIQTKNFKPKEKKVKEKRDFEKKKGQEKEDAMDVDAPAAPKVPARLQELKLRYYELMVQIHEEKDDLLEICRCYLSMYDTECVKASAEQFIPVLKNACWYLVLSETGPMQVSLLEQVGADGNFEKIGAYKALIADFKSQMPIQWSAFKEKYAAEVQAATHIFAGAKGEARYETLRQRAIQHNVLVMSKYYERVQIGFLAKSLDLDAGETERRVAEMVEQGLVWAKIDQLDGVIQFKKEKDVNQALNDWSSNIGTMLELMEKTTFLINKEFQTHKVGA